MEADSFSGIGSLGLHLGTILNTMLHFVLKQDLRIMLRVRNLSSEMSISASMNWNARCQPRKEVTVMNEGFLKKS